MPNFKQFQLPKQANERAREATEDVVPDFELRAPNILRTDKDQNLKNLHIVTDNETTVKHGQKIKVTEVVAGAANTHFTRLNEYNVAIKDVTISRGVCLPKASLAGIGKIYMVKDMSGSAAATSIAIAPFDGDLIDGDTTDGINVNYGTRRFVSDGSNWFTW
jgi:hypothetical protein